MGNRKTTIFKQLILNVVIPAILAILALGVINLFQTWSILQESSETESQIISEEIKQIHELQDMAMEILENMLDEELEAYSQAMVTDYFSDTRDIEDADLNRIRGELGMDPSLIDLYIIDKEGVIVNTTFESDLGLHLAELGEEHAELLHMIRERGEFLSESFTIEFNTRRLRKFTYQPTNDSLYIIEIGLYSTTADSIINYVKHQINEMSNVQKNVVSVDLIINAETPFSLNGEGELVLVNTDAFEEVLETRGQVSLDIREDGIPYRYEFTFMDRKNTSLYKESVIRIKSDRRNDIRVLRLELLKFFLIFGITVIAVVILLYRKTRVITDPIKRLVSNVNRITAGHLNERADVVGNNEIASLSEQFNDMISQLESYYNELEEKVRERTAEVVAQKEEIEAQNDTLTEQRNMLREINESLQKAYTEIEASIHYASRIQNAILPPPSYLKKNIPNAFFFYKPRDIVSGDFYWVAAKDDKLLVAAVDCTGHGVPGAFMSIVGNNTLNYALNVLNETQPAKILKILNSGVEDTLRQQSDNAVHDGMDLAMVTIDKKHKYFEFAGAFNPLIYFKNGEMIKVKADRVAVGGHILPSGKEFTNHRFDYEEGEMIYLFSDGFPDQFGGEKGGKYMSGRFVKLLEKINQMTLKDQIKTLEQELQAWQGEEPQIDDILVVGIKL